jgi:hypothetical protein
MQKLLAAALICLGCHTLYAQNDTSINAAYNKLNGSPYFESNEWQKGSVTYNNVQYNDVMLKYDMIADELIVLHPNNIFAVTLASERVQSFMLGQQEFIYVPRSNKAGLKQSGFYHVLVNGKLSVLLKQNKTIEEKTSVNEVERTVVMKEQFYVVKDGAATVVTGEDSVMDLLGDKARQVRAYLRSREIKFRKAKEITLIEIANYYNQLAK